MPEFLDQQRINEMLAQYMRENFLKEPETHEQRSIRNRMSTWSEAIRKKISTFIQLPSELFWQAWQRFDGYRKERPHHGYSDTEVLLFFYNGIKECHQDELDDDAFLEFSVQDTQVAYSLIEDLAASSYAESKNPTPQPSESQTTLDEIRELFSNGIVEITKIGEEIKEIANFDSKLITSDTQMRMAGNQVDEEVEVTESQQGTLPMCTVVEEEIERVDSGLAVVGAESAEDNHLPPLPKRADTLEEELGTAESKEVMNISCTTPSIVKAIQPPPVVEEKVIRKCGSTLRNKLATSFGDSRRLELSVKFEKTMFATSYYDSGSSLNWMTYATARSLGFTSNHFKDTELSLEFADQSETLALGILKGLAVTVDNLPLQVDFAVLALGEEFDDTLILGKPFEWVVRFIIDVQEENTGLHLGDNTTTSQEETEMRANELETIEAESADEIDFPPTSERVGTLEGDLGAAESKDATPNLVEEPLPIATIQTTLAVQEEVITLDENTLQSQNVQQLEDATRSELCMETEDMSLAETCHDSSSVETEDFSLVDAEDIIESAAMPRTGPDKPKDHQVSQFDKIVHNDIGDSLANIWSMSKKGNGFPWDDGISAELKLSNDPWLDGRNFWVSNFLQPHLISNQNRSGSLIKDGGKTAGIPRTGPDIPSFHEFDQSQFLRFAGEGGCITYCDVIGSVTRPPEVLLNVPVPC